MNLERHELSSIFGNIPDEEYQSLKDDIEQNGFRDPNILTYEDKILDGWHRYNVSVDLGIESEITFTEIPDGVDPVAFVRSNNLHRRQLTASQRAQIEVELSEWETDGRPITSQFCEVKTEELNVTNVKKEVDERVHVADSKEIETDNNSNVKTRVEMATNANVGTTSIDKAKQVKRLGREQEVISGEKSADAVIKEHKQEQLKKEHQELIDNPPPLPAGQYRTIVIDPPWEMTKIKRDVRPNQEGFDYPTMSVEEIMDIELPLADDAFVFLWTTQKYLPDAFAVIEEWGLKYRFTMVWNKPGGMQVYNYPQMNCEFVVVGSIGNPKFLDTKAFNTSFEAPRAGHSVKPEEFYDVVRRVCSAPRIDMFNRRDIDGFDVWGNESNSKIEVDDE